VIPFNDATTPDIGAYEFWGAEFATTPLEALT
jgi:hypothetical protein